MPDPAADKPSETVTAYATIAEVLDYLKGAGWLVTKTTLYRHQGEGKILATDGLYRQKDIEKYAKAWLRRQATGMRVKDQADDLQRKKLDLEIQNLEIERRRKEMILRKEEERYIPREQMDLELAARAGVLEAGLRHWVQSRAAEWIRAVGGDVKRVGDFINLMNHDLDEHINNYASQAEYQVVIEGDVGPEEEVELQNDWKREGVADE